MPKLRKRVAEGVYQSSMSTVSAKVQVGSGKKALTVEQSFPLGTPLSEIREWQEEKRVELRRQLPKVARGTIKAEVTTYLNRCKQGQASLPAKSSEMNAWIAVIGRFRRHQVKSLHINRAIRDWLNTDVAPKTIVNRCRTLHHFYVVMADDKRTITPLDNVELPKVDKPKPKATPAQILIDTEARFRALIEDRRVDPTLNKTERAQEIDALTKARARFMVFATDGLRPSQLKRVRRHDVDLSERTVTVQAGKGGNEITIAMNDDSFAAWSAFVEADAFGAYDDSKYRSRLRAAGWPEGVRPYNTKHSVGIALAEAGVDYEDIRDWFGHTDTKTTRIYTGTPIHRMRQAAKALQHRLGWGGTKSHAEVPRTKAELSENRRKSAKSSKRRKSA